MPRHPGTTRAPTVRSAALTSRCRPLGTSKRSGGAREEAKEERCQGMNKTGARWAKMDCMKPTRWPAVGHMHARYEIKA